MKFSIDGRVAAVGVDARDGGRAPARDRVTDLAGDRDGPYPGQRVGKIAEAFAEIDRRRVRIEGVSADASRARPAPFDAETDRHYELVGRILDDPIFERGLKILKTVRSHPRRSARRAEMAISRTNRYCEGLSDPLGEFTGKIALSERWIVAGLEAGDSRKRQLIVDAGIIDRKCGRKEAIADDFVGDASADGNERYGEPRQARTPKTGRHENSLQG